MYTLTTLHFESLCPAEQHFSTREAAESCARTYADGEYFKTLQRVETTSANFPFHTVEELWSTAPDLE